MSPPAPVPAAPPVPQPAAAAVTPLAAPPADLWKTEAGKEIAADRTLIESVLANVRATVEHIHTERAARLSELQHVAVAMALTIATRLLHEQVEAGAFAIEAKVRDMIAQLGDDIAVTIRLNPADLALLTQRLGGEQLTEDHADPRFVPDPELGRSDCQVEGRESMLLSDVSRDLEEIRDELLRRLKNARS